MKQTNSKATKVKKMEIPEKNSEKDEEKLVLDYSLASHNLYSF